MSLEAMIKGRINESGDKKIIAGGIVEEVRKQVIDNRRIQNAVNPKNLEEIWDEIWNAVEHKCWEHSNTMLFTSAEKAAIMKTTGNIMFGYGVLDPLIEDASVTEIMVNGKDSIFIEREGKLTKALDSNGNPLAFDSEQELQRIIERIVMPVNRKVDESNPIADARLPNGFRVNIVLRPLSLGGNTVTIRKFPEYPYTMDDLIGLGMLNNEAANFLKKMVENRYNIVISGGTGSGKTTFLNALSDYIPKDSRIITIEDSAELKILGIENLIRLETRTANIEGKGAVSMRDLVRAALRMRPDRIIVGEVRGGEALDMLQAMNTGHEGSLSTGHANSAEDMLGRLETMVLMADVDLPLAAVRHQISSAVDIIVHLAKMGNGQRRVMQIVEIAQDNNGEYKINPLFQLNNKTYQLEKTPHSLTRTFKMDLYGEK